MKGEVQHGHELYEFCWIGMLRDRWRSLLQNEFIIIWMKNKYDDTY